ncbi:enoyl-CoA hydratase/carnithine racemase [Brevibacterium sanguinis]|uniref:Enoyl-CoA hydratase/carnithine racemase n=2 Tax=Brevibacterium TaxID=1696 RepID=A0A366IH33_9MICO|nr:MULTISPECIES: enoyl-CoA hydratase/isomerase family protein [Brevibacterium]RBP63140.1 enoyl-CoA hydratase/carnithine racemase [Brevibacterium sanguinis]RBP69684.1 enoyl-CoA hydratase/carnithine racemase [Brevibacterium celere]
MTADGSHRRIDHEGFELTVTGGVGTLVIDRPEKRNALSRAMWRALPEIIAEVDADDAIGALIITGAHGHFSAGSDIADLDVPLAEFWELNSTAEAAVANARTTTIAAIEGSCVGGGTEIAVACDLRVAAPGSVFGVTAAKLGLVYPPGPTRRLAAVIGESWARYLLVTASIVPFEQMDRLGFFHAVSETPLEAARELGERITGLSRLSQLGTRAVLAGELRETGLVEAVDANRSAAGQAPAFTPPEWLDAAYREEIARGQEAFFAKRRPEFRFAATDWP